MTQKPTPNAMRWAADLIENSEDIDDSDRSVAAWLRSVADEPNAKTARAQALEEAEAAIKNIECQTAQKGLMKVMCLRTIRALKEKS